MGNKNFEEAVEAAVGVSVEKIRRAPLYSGAGAVYRGNTLVTHEEADRMFSKATGWSPPSRSIREIISGGIRYLGKYFSRSKSQ